MAKPFKVGDEVLVTRAEYYLEDEPGRIATLRGCSEDTCSVEFFRPIAGSHSCGIGLENGLWINDKDIKLKNEKVKEEKKMAKFNPGDKIMVRYWDDMMDEYKETTTYGSIQGPGDCFTEDMKMYCGKIFTVSSRSLLGSASNLGCTWYDWMFSLVEKAKPKKKLTVAEIEKILGYGVEVIKE